MDKGCPGCPVVGFARPAILTHRDRGNWVEAAFDAEVNLVALFRDPGIHRKRHVQNVLDLVFSDDRGVRNQTHCWTDRFVQALGGLPGGLTVALENGVRCACPKHLGLDAYRHRLERCWPHTLSWLRSLPSNHERIPLVLCDKDLIEGLASMGSLKLRSGEPWQSPRPFWKAVGRFVRVEGGAAIVLAHPIVVRRYPGAYTEVVRKAVSSIKKLGSTGRLPRGAC
ncbi:MAG: hypothetical protein O7H41_11480 [Planctomycetota bacterium]|nr:hypothetical protein [Planctomycetota bacterium]